MSEPASHSLAELLTHNVSQDASGRLLGLLGCVGFIALAWLMSNAKRRVSWRLVAVGTALQFAFAAVVLKTSIGRGLFSWANDAVNQLLSYSQAGSRFLFGQLADNKIPVGVGLSGSPDDPRINVADPQLWASVGSMIAFRVLPTIIFFSALTALCYHLGLLQRVVRVLSVVMEKTMGVSGAESLSTSANIFLGQTEAPLVVRPYVARMTKSELMCVMTGGFATVAGGVLAAYVGMLSSTFPDIAGHLLAASVMAAPATLVMAKIMVPETEVPETLGGAKLDEPSTDASVADALSRGTTEGMQLALNVAAMLISFLAVVALLNAVVSGVGGWLGHPEWSLQLIGGYIGAPLAMMMGTSAVDAVAIGQLLGTKTVINEFVAYAQLSSMISSGVIHEGKSVVIASYALCGFANFGSIGIQIGGLAALAPSRRSDIASLGFRAMIAGSLASFQTAAVAAILL
jgi:concentrative nucleoside transporter, CNT family